MGDRIEHQGVVESIGSECVRVSIIQTAACMECKAKSLCSSSEMKEKVIDVFGRYENLHVGDAVTVCGSLQMGRKAVRYAFVLPTVLLLLVGFVCLGLLGMDEKTVLLLMLLCMVAYFAVMYAVRGRIEREFRFWIEKPTAVV